MCFFYPNETTIVFSILIFLQYLYPYTQFLEAFGEEIVICNLRRLEPKILKIQKVTTKKLAESWIKTIKFT